MRWAPDARGRLQAAAFDLFGEQGYSATTIPQIAARAGLATRTFFRYFADKREVIFDGDEIPGNAAQLIRTAPADQRPMDVIRSVLVAIATERFDGRKRQTATWRAIIDSDDSLRDRDARKRADIVVAATAAFVERGESAPNAVMFAELGALVFHVALNRWLTEPGHRSMAHAVADTLVLLTTSVAASAHTSAPAPPGALHDAI